MGQCKSQSTSRSPFSIPRPLARGPSARDSSLLCEEISSLLRFFYNLIFHAQFLAQASGWAILRVGTAMGIFLDEPKFPVIERNPTASSTISNFSFSDYIRITAMTGASLPVGYLAGGSVNIRGPSMYTAGIIGLMGGFMYAYQCSAGRLMGMFPNDDEVARYKR